MWLYTPPVTRVILNNNTLKHTNSLTFQVQNKNLRTKYPICSSCASAPHFCRIQCIPNNLKGEKNVKYHDINHCSSFTFVVYLPFKGLARCLLCPVVPFGYLPWIGIVAFFRVRVLYMSFSLYCPCLPMLPSILKLQQQATLNLNGRKHLNCRKDSERWC